jgi:4-alpha-glucanotransferase
LKVLRWEREWHSRHQPFKRPEDYPAESVAISGTHDTATLAEWWDGADRRERALCAEIPGLREASCDPDAPYDDRLRDALLQVLFRAGSDIVIIPFQDLFGWRDRVNLPGVVNDGNWTWRLPWPIDDLVTLPEARERAAFVSGLSRASRRCHS